jgi:DNA-directed RNA polymerase subunit F
MDDQPEEPTDEGSDADESVEDLEDVPATEIDISYELDEWSSESRELLARLLTTNEVTHAWQGGTLSVNGEHEVVVDELIAEVEATLLPALDPESEKVVYEVAEWTPEGRADLTDALAEEGVRYVFDDMGDLVVEAIDEDRVDSIVDELTDGEEEDEVEAPVATDVLSELFVAADKLRKSPRDGKTIARAIEEATTIIAMSPPYGFERATWAKVGLRAGALRSVLEREGGDDEDVVAAAEELRDLLHPMV